MIHPELLQSLAVQGVFMYNKRASCCNIMPLLDFPLSIYYILIIYCCRA
nr:MAG TPA: hypothetical protein [Caudoviricetes sp.]DAH18920.1 MAG TPA: hypothetical protein [Caudoviricetes sp.]